MKDLTNNRYCKNDTLYHIKKLAVCEAWKFCLDVSRINHGLYRRCCKDIQSLELVKSMWNKVLDYYNYTLEMFEEEDELCLPHKYFEFIPRIKDSDYFVYQSKRLYKTLKNQKEGVYPICEDIKAIELLDDVLLENEKLINHFISKKKTDREFCYRRSKICQK